MWFRITIAPNSLGFVKTSKEVFAVNLEYELVNKLFAIAEVVYIT